MRIKRIQNEYYPEYSDEWLIERYFKYGSVEDALYQGNSYIPFSSAEYHRKLEKFGIIKSAGRHTSLSEALHFFRLKQMEPGAPLESIYKTMPPSFQTSVATLHRIYNRIIETKHKAVATRHATALLITPKQDPTCVLIGTELFSEKKYGKIAGQCSIPMTFSKTSDTTSQRILRVLQQEVLTSDAIEKKFCNPEYIDNLVHGIQRPFLKYRLLDVEIECYKLTISEDINQFRSYKLSSYQFINHLDISNDTVSRYRIGVPEIVTQGFLNERSAVTHEVVTSCLNVSLSTEEGPSQKLALRYSK